MNGILAQLISIAAYGNQYLLHGIIPTNYFGDNTSFQFCNSVKWYERQLRFPFLRSSYREVAADPLTWFADLKKKGAFRIGLYKAKAVPHPIGSEHMLAGFTGTGLWHLTASFPGHTDYWSNQWEVTDKNNADRRIWSVKYAMTGKRIPPFIAYDLEQARIEFKDILQRIRHFAFENRLDDFAGTFEKALGTLDNNQPRDNYYHHDLVPSNFYSLSAEQLLFAAAKSYVFGGMGSWNDLGFDSKDITARYDTLSAELYQAVNTALATAINAKNNDLIQ